MNDNTNDNFEELQRRQKRLFEMNSLNNYNLFGDNNNEKSLEQKNKDLDKKLISLYRLHSSKFHKHKNIQNPDDLLNIHSNIFKKSNQEKLSNPRNNDNSMTKLRKKIAFKFRFLNSSNSVNNISPKKLKIFNFRKRINKMNKILKISKSIRDKMFKDLYTIKSDDMKNNNIYGYNYSFKAQRYSGNIYNYYKSDRPININIHNNALKIKSNFNFEYNTCLNHNKDVNNKSDNFKIENNNEKNIMIENKKIKLDDHSKDNKDNNFKSINNDSTIQNRFYRNQFHKFKISKSKGDNLIKLSSLLL